MIDLSGRKLTLDSMLVHNNLSVMGGATLGETMIAGSLLVDATIKIDMEGIQSIGQTLYLQPDRLAGLDIMGGSMIVDTSGNVLANGNFRVNGVVGADFIAPNKDAITIDLSRSFASDSASISTASAFGRLLVKGIDGTTVAAFGADGSASVSGTFTAKELKAQKLTVVRGEESTGSALLTASVGEAILPRGSTMVTIATSATERQSIIFVTPTTQTDKTLSVIDKRDGSFTIAIPTPSLTDITFNWWVIN